MKRHFNYFIIAFLTFLAGASLYFMFSQSQTQSNVPEPEPPVGFVSNNQNGGKPCLANTAYRFENNGYDDTGPVSPYCAKLQMDLLAAATSGNVEAARHLLSEGATANSPGLSGGDYYNPLVLAAFAGHTEMVRLLLDNGADVNREQCCCMSCSTALTHAVDTGNVEIVKLLIARGADVHYTSHYDREWTMRRRAEKDGNKEIIELLDAAGAMSWQHRAVRRIANLVGKNPN